MSSFNGHVGILVNANRSRENGGTVSLVFVPKGYFAVNGQALLFSVCVCV